ncbi:ABC transporter ATP-binding protein [Roseivirga seohaensis]|uniref:ABC transporter ATP-binding protein n=1 Tax=Roseivirga seohaensis TaxID=1914963 RepID=UPI003BA9584C
MSFLKKAIKKYFQSLAYFYSHLRYRVFIVLSLSIFVGVLDGFGLAMFIPLLKMVDGGSTASTEGLGNLSFLVDGLAHFNIPFNLYSVLILILMFFSLKGFFKFIEGYAAVVYRQFFIRKIRIDNSNALSKLRFVDFINTDGGRIQNTFSAEVGRVNYAFGAYLSAAQSAIMVGVYLGLAIMTNAQFALLISIGGGLTNIIFKRLYKITKKSSKEYTAYAHSFQGLLIQKVANFKYLKATALIFIYTEKLKHRIREMEVVQRRMGVLDSAMLAIREPMIIMVVVLVIMVQVEYFSESLGSIILSLLFFYRALSFLMGMQKQWNSFLTASGALENMTSFMRELKQGEEAYGVRKFKKFEQKISLNNVNFTYGENSVVNNVNLTINKNETIAFVGESGSGKTTLMNIVIGLLKPTEGSIEIDNIDYRKLDIRSLQKRMGYITQEPVIFADTIFNNVTFWDEPTKENQKRFGESLKKAAIYDFIQEQPLQEQTLLGGNGINLSGGQKQRLSIARELYKEVDFLLMDEATSALDSETERAIQKHIDELKGEYTIIIIAHRLSTVKNADRIVLMKNGQIEAMGDFATLNSKSYVFREMVEYQKF